MDRKLERSNKEKILRRVARHLAPLGYKRTKPTFYTRVALPVIEFVHIHKFTFAPAFRVHLGIRVINDPAPNVNLNGPDSDQYRGTGPFRSTRFDFNFEESEEAVECCARDISHFVDEIAEPWFASHRDLAQLASSTESPLHQNAREALLRALSGIVEEQYVSQTRENLNAP